MAKLRRVMLSAAASAAVLASAACTGGGTGDDSGGTSTPGSVEEREAAVDPALLAVGRLLDDNGVLPVARAEQVFATLVAPLPGVNPVDLGDDPPADLAATAIRRLDGARPGLSKATVTAVDAALEVPEGEEEVEIPAGSGRAREFDPAPGPVDPPSPAELADLVGGIVAEFESRSGRDLRLPIRARVSGRGSAFASSIRSSSDRVTGCRIAVPASVFGPDSASAVSTVAHEVWHCFQLDANQAAFEGGPLWVIEGQAEFAGEDYVGGSASSAGRWNTWLINVEGSLWRRSYDAIGVYAVAEQQGSDVWPAMLAMLGRAGPSAVETLFGGSGAAAAVEATAARLVRAPHVGAVWESQGPGITIAQGAPVLGLTEGSDQEVRRSAGRFATLPVVLAVPDGGDIVRVRVEGGTAARLQLPGAAMASLAPGATARYCLDPGGCTCPDGSHPGGSPLPAASPGEGAVAIGTLDAGELAVAGGFESLDDACRRSLAGTWTTDVASYLAIVAPGPGPSCSGPYTLTFGADGSFRAGFDAACTVPGGSGTATASFTGSYTEDAGTFTLSGVRGGGTMTIRVAGQSRTQPLPVGPPASGAVPYSIEGDVLTYTFRGDTFTFTRTR